MKQNGEIRVYDNLDPASVDRERAQLLEVLKAIEVDHRERETRYSRDITLPEDTPHENLIATYRNAEQAVYRLQATSVVRAFEFVTAALKELELAKALSMDRSGRLFLGVLRDLQEAHATLRRDRDVRKWAAERKEAGHE